MKALRRMACVLLAALSFVASPVHSTSFSLDQSDLYFIVAESGWGIQIVQRGSIIFATMFIYGPSGAPTWYVATMGPSAPTNGNPTWSGDLFATTGPYFGTTPFNPANVIATKVGTMTWVSTSATTGTLTYSVDGVNVVKNVTRETLVLDDYSGTFIGAIRFVVNGCTDPSNNVPQFDAPFTVFTVTQNGTSVTLDISIVGIMLTVTGTLTQDGQFGTVTGTYSADGGEVGNGTVSALNVQLNSIAGSYALNSTNDGCQNSGYFAAMRGTPPIMTSVESAGAGLAGSVGSFARQASRAQFVGAPGAARYPGRTLRSSPR